MKLPDLVDRREMVTRKFGHGRTRWTRINHDLEAMTIWNGWVLAAPTREEMLRRAADAYNGEAGRAALQQDSQP